jgi:hypothetical protein
MYLHLLRSVFIGVRTSGLLFHKCSLLAEIGWQTLAPI